MTTFGTVHELAGIEVKIRRDLQEAQHEITCAVALIENEALLNSNEHDQLKAMLIRAKEAITRVNGG